MWNDRELPLWGFNTLTNSKISRARNDGKSQWLPNIEKRLWGAGIATAVLLKKWVSSERAITEPYTTRGVRTVPGAGVTNLSQQCDKAVRPYSTASFFTVNFVDYHKYNSEKRSYYGMRNISDRACRGNGLPVVIPWKAAKEKAMRNIKPKSQG